MVNLTARLRSHYSEVRFSVLVELRGVCVYVGAFSLVNQSPDVEPLEGVVQKLNTYFVSAGSLFYKENTFGDTPVENGCSREINL